MGSRVFLRPENAIAKAEEFVKVGKPTRAMETLYEVIRSRKRSNHSFSESVLEKIMYTYLELCIDRRSAYIAKEGLYHYRNMTQSTNVASLASVIQFYLSSTEKRTEAAQIESKELVGEMVDDLENLNTPEIIMLRAVSGEDAQDRSDRTVLIPWVKFLWESYLQCLELLRTNSRVEKLYHDVAQQALRFCLKYQRRTEFRLLCEKIRTHLGMAMKWTQSHMSLDLNSLETQQLNLDTRLVQLDYAIQLELWHEAYKAVEDIHGLMMISKKNFQPKTMSNYYQKLALVFWKSGYHLFHACAILKHFQLSREMKKNLTPEELGRMASRVLMAVLATPLSDPRPEFDQFIEMELSPQDKVARLALLLGMSVPPTRASLIKDLTRFGILQAAFPEIQELYNHLEVDFEPMKLCARVQSCVDHVIGSEELSFLEQYIPTLKDITLVRLLKQVSQIYKSICFNRLLELAPFSSPFALERLIVECARFNDLQVRIDHRSRTIHFGTELSESVGKDDLEGPHLQDMPSEQLRTQLMVMMSALEKSIQTIAPDKVKVENNALRTKIIEAYQHSKVRDHERILLRQKAIENRKEYLEKKAYELAMEEENKKEEALKKAQLLEEKRLEAEKEEREKRKMEEEIRQIQLKHNRERMDNIAQTEVGKKILEKLDEEEIANLDADSLVAKQVSEMEKERRELIARLKSQEKKIDHFERAKRQEEITLLQKQFEKELEDDKVFWAQKEEDRIKQAKEDRKNELESQSRLSRMKEDKDVYLSNLLKERRSVFEKKCVEFNKYLEVEKKKRLAARKKIREAERREKWIKEKEAEEQRKRDEKMEEERRLERERIRQEEIAWQKKREELDAIEAKKRQREKEIEEKMKLEEEKLRTKREETSGKERPPPSRVVESDNWRDNQGLKMRGGGDSKDLRRDDRDFGKGDREFRRDDRDFGRSDRDFGRSDRDFGRGDREFRRDDRDFGRSDRDFGRGDREFRRDDRDFGRGDRDFGRGDREFRRDDRDFGRGDREFRRGDRDFGRGDREFRRNDRDFGRGDRDFGRGDREFRRGDHGIRQDDRELRRGDNRGIRRDDRGDDRDMVWRRGNDADRARKSGPAPDTDDWRGGKDDKRNKTNEDRSDDGWTTVKR